MLVLLLFLLLLSQAYAHTIDGRCYPDEGPYCEDAPFVRDGICHLDLWPGPPRPYCPVVPTPDVLTPLFE